jgi:hypothetical protein
MIPRLLGCQFMRWRLTAGVAGSASSAVLGHPRYVNVRTSALPLGSHVGKRSKCQLPSVGALSHMNQGCASACSAVSRTVAGAISRDNKSRAGSDTKSGNSKRKSGRKAQQIWRTKERTVRLFNRGVPRFWTYGSVCCACAQRPGLPRACHSG